MKPTSPASLVAPALIVVLFVLKGELDYLWRRMDLKAQPPGPLRSLQLPTQCASPLSRESSTARRQMLPQTPSQSGQSRRIAPPPHSRHVLLNAPAVQTAPQDAQIADSPNVTLFSARSSPLDYRACARASQ